MIRQGPGIVSLIWSPRPAGLVGCPVPIVTLVDNFPAGQNFAVTSIQCDANLIWADVITSNLTDRAFMIQVDFVPRPA